jgi:hypothetical protein
MEEILSFTTTWINVEELTPSESEISQVQKDRSCKISLKCGEDFTEIKRTVVIRGWERRRKGYANERVQVSVRQEEYCRI